MIAEAEKRKKVKIKDSDLIARLERIVVPDTPILEPHEESEPTDASSNASELKPLTPAEQIVATECSPENIACTSQAINQNPDILSLGTLDATDPLCCTSSVPAEAPSRSEPTSQLSEQPSICDQVACVECDLPPALSHDCLRNLYICCSLDRLDAKEEEFLQDLTGISSFTSPGDIEKDPFAVLLCRYIHVWDQWNHSTSRFQMLGVELHQMSQKLWNVQRKRNSVTGKCKDGVSVSLEYEYEEAELDHAAIAELTESEGVIRWIVFEELPCIAYTLSQLRTQITEHILSVATSHRIYPILDSSEPIQLLSCDPEPSHFTLICNLRSICMNLFSAVRQHARNSQSRPRDSTLTKQLHDWTLFTASILLRSCRPDDHLFLLMHLLRLPSRHLRAMIGILNPPDATLAWDRSTDMVDFLHQPEVELLLSLFALCLRPVRDRHYLLTSNSELPGAPTTPSDSPPRQINKSRWTVVDSGGESDQEDSELFSEHQPDSPSPSDSSSLEPESSIFVSPRDLERLLRQLNLERLLRLLVSDIKYSTHQSAHIGGTGLLTLLAFADKLIDLVQACGAIFSEHLKSPKPRAHLSCWRILAKRLAGLISLLVVVIGSRIRHAWIQQTSSESVVDFRRVLSQYDSFCLRAAECLLSGCGLPSTHRDAVRLVCWRSFAALFPFGFTASRSKVDLLNLMLTSILPSWNASSSVQLTHLPNQLAISLHRSLLSIGLNDVGLEAVLTALGKLATLECRPIVTSTVEVNYQLPSLEADLIRFITRILFAVSVFHTPGPTDTDSHPMGSSTLALIPIAPECGRRQLVDITCVHTHQSLPLLFDLIMTAGGQLSRTESVKLSDRVFLLTVPDPMSQPFRVHELLLTLSMELPLHLLRPEASHMSILISWLVDQPLEKFEHLLAQTLLQRLNWESVINSDTGEPFIPFSFHLDLALALAHLVDKHVLYSNRFHSIVYHPMLNRVLSSTKSSASSAVGTFFTTLGYRQLQIQRPLTSASDHRSRGFSRRSDLLLSSYSLDSVPIRRSKSHVPTSDPDDFIDTSKQIISWCADLLLRLHLPGCAASSDHFQSQILPNRTNDLTRMWKLVSQLNLERNPVASFLVISLNMQLFGQSSAPSSETSVYHLVNTIIASQLINLILRTFSLLFHHYASTTIPVTCPEFSQSLSRVFQFHTRGQSQLISNSTSTPLLVGACLDACLAHPYSCLGLLISLTDCVTQPEWLQSLDYVSLLESVFQITVWIHNSYIPILLSSKADITGWYQCTLFQAFKNTLQETFTSQSSSSSSTRWMDQLNALTSVASWTWHHSARVLQGLKGRILGSPLGDAPTSTDLPSDSLSLSDAEFSTLFGKRRSVLFTIWLEICSLQSSAHTHVDYHKWSPHPLWLLSVLFVVDLEQQTIDDCPGVPDRCTYEHTSVWTRLSTVLASHLDELITVFHNPGVPVISDCPLGSSLALFLERLLLEADLLCPDSSTSTGSTDQSQSVLLTRIRAELIQLSMIQGVSLLDTCPPSHPTFVLILHSLLTHLLSIRKTSRSHAICNSTFPVGFALLRCLPWSLFRLPFLSPVEFSAATAKPNDLPEGRIDHRSLLDIILTRLRKQLVFYGGITDHPVEQAKCMRVMQDVINLLSELDNLMSRGRFFNLDQKCSVLDPIHRRDTVDALLDIFDWRTLSSRLQHYTQLWSEHRLSSVVCSAPPTAPSNPPKNLLMDLCTRSANEQHQSLADISLNCLLAASLSSSLPSSIAKYPHRIQELRTSLSRHIERLCDRIATVEQLQTKRRTTLIPNLYRVITVKKTDQVECKPILPPWMTGSKGCARGAILTAEYQTVTKNEKIATSCAETDTQLNELLNTLVNDVRSAITVFLPDVVTHGNRIDRISWSDIAFHIEWTVDHLLQLSRNISTKGHDSDVENYAEIRRVGVDCFEQLCRNLSGPLLQCPVSKKLISNCIQRLAEEFLATLSTGYERILDLLVALPHLSVVLLRAFTPPDQISFGVDRTKDSHTHHLLPIYERLPDIRFRCGPKIANELLATIDIKIWSDEDENHRLVPSNRYMSMVRAICACITHTDNSMEVEAPDTFDTPFTALCCEHLRAILNNRLDDLLAPFFHLLLQDIRYFNSETIWTCLLDVLDKEIIEYDGLSLSTEKLSTLLTSLATSLSNNLSSTAGTFVARESLLDELLNSTGESVTLLVVTIFGKLIREFGAKLSVCVREHHMTAHYASSRLMEHVVQLLGPFACRSTLVTFESIETSDCLNHRHLSILETCLSSTTDTLQRATQACPPNLNPTWSYLLSDSFVYWLLTAVCPCGRSDSTNSTQSTSSLPCSPSDSTPPISLFAALCAIKECSQANAESHRKLLDFSFFSKTFWQPSINALNAMIQVLIKSRDLPRPFSSMGIAFAMIELLKLVEWPVAYQMADEVHPISISSHLKTGSLGPTSFEVQSSDPRIAFLESLSFALVLLTLCARNGDTELRNSLQQIIEAVLSNLHFFQVNSNFYSLILSHLVEAHVPAYCVLMPPTCLEGRLFGLMASVAGMISTTAQPDSLPPPEYHEAQLSPTNAYPQLPAIPFVSIDNDRMIHRKRLAYVHKIITLLQCAILRGDVPAHGLDDLLADPENSSYSLSSHNHPLSHEPTLLDRIRQPVGTVFRRFIPHALVSGLGLSEMTPDSYTSMDPARLLIILGRLRVGNLLSELEAVAGSAAWECVTSPKFKFIAELCHEVFRLLTVARPPRPSTPNRNSSGDRFLERSTTLICESSILWLLGDSTSHMQSADPIPLGIMPRSINAGLSLPICYTLLSLGQLDDECTPASLHVLDSAMWSALTFAPASISLSGRFKMVVDVVRSAHQATKDVSQIPFASTTGWIHCCLHHGLSLPLLLFSFTANQECNNPEQHGILVADLLHWLSAMNLRKITVDNHAFHLHGFLLLLAFTVKVATTTSIREISMCCPSHPAWLRTSSQCPTTIPYECTTAVHVMRLHSVLQALYEYSSKVQQLRTTSLDNQKECARRFASFIVCLGTLTEEWLTSVHSDSNSPNFFSHLTDCKSDSSCINTDLASFVSTLSSMRARLSTWSTLNEGCHYLILEWWSPLRIHFSQMLTFLLTSPPD